MKYKLMDNCIKDLETGGYIPLDEGNRHFTEYMLWCAEGNSPEPKVTAEEQLVLDAQAIVAEAHADIRHIDRSLLKLIIRLYQALAANGHINKADVGAKYIDGALALRDKLAVVEANE